MRYRAATCRKSSVDTRSVYWGVFALVALLCDAVRLGQSRTRLHERCIVSTEIARAGVSTCKFYNMSRHNVCVFLHRDLVLQRCKMHDFRPEHDMTSRRYKVFVCFVLPVCLYHLKRNPAAE